MDKKKALICTILFAIVLIGVLIGMFFVKSDNEFKVWMVITCCITGNWMANCIIKFYNWMMK